ncbi:hypothetical protein [Bailinhaonella thermotolerans]|uniref:Uncharacterized protein n=1 Tax=Bailinhaonella thermotolerans TaxID=1070861 RepID=A0A3A4AG81_9ACTN|nr:hypothetical protein [Bailinhaonella thermotolerans]RJL19240.1 hypothetical protein D5H75_40555 [Bailinhaonella thermotolerans]
MTTDTRPAAEPATDAQINAAGSRLAAALTAAGLSATLTGSRRHGGRIVVRATRPSTPATATQPVTLTISAAHAVADLVGALCPR